jgi:hypothetical protein
MADAVFRYKKEYFIKEKFQGRLCYPPKVQRM